MTDEERARSAEAIAQLKRDLKSMPTPQVSNPGKFNGPIGLDDDGNYQKPLTPEEIAHKEEIRRRATDS